MCCEQQNAHPTSNLVLYEWKLIHVFYVTVSHTLHPGINKYVYMCNKIPDLSHVYCAVATGYRIPSRGKLGFNTLHYVCYVWHYYCLEQVFIYNHFLYFSWCQALYIALSLLHCKQLPSKLVGEGETYSRLAI